MTGNASIQNSPLFDFSNVTQQLSLDDESAAAIEKIKKLSTNSLFLNQIENLLSQENAMNSDKKDTFFSIIQRELIALFEDQQSDHDAFRCVENALASLETLNEKVDAFPFKRLIVIGMGASILNPLSVLKSIPITSDTHKNSSKNQEKEVRFIFDLEYGAIEEATSGIDAKDIGFLIISKSGSTLETTTLTLLVRKWLKAHHLPIRNHLALIKGEGASHLEKIACHDGIEHQFTHPAIGGRFASFTTITLVPGLFLGLPMHDFLQGAKKCLNDTQKEGAKSSVGEAVAFHFSSFLLGRRLQLIETFSHRYKALTEWWCQLWAESLGKFDGAITPMASKGPFDHHSQWQLHLSSPKERCFTFIAPSPNKTKSTRNYGYLCEQILAKKIGADYFSKCTLDDVLLATYTGATSALNEKNVPFYTLWMPDNDNKDSLFAVGYMMMHTILTVLTTGRLIGVNPFGQPAVESLKTGAKKFIDTMSLS